MEEMKKDENLKTQETVVEETVEVTEEAAETVEAEVVEDGEIVDEKDEKIAQLEQQAADNLDKYQRCLAEFDNFRKRTVKEKASMYDDGVRSTVEKLLMVIDNLERALKTEVAESDEGFKKGVEMTYHQLIVALKNEGVEEIDCLNKPFDANLAQAIMQEKKEDVETGTVIEILQKGYILKDRILRPAMVKVSE